MRKNSLCHVVFFAMLAILLGRAEVLGQATGTISGTVTDQAGGLISGAQITITNVETGQVRTLKADDAGRYYAPALPPGNYQVAAVASGFEKLVRSDITLTVGHELVIDFSMHPGAVSETINVSGSAPLVQTTTASLSELVDSQKVRALPLNGRSFDQLIYLQPGVTVATAAGSSPNQGRGVKFSVAGARLTSNVFMLDGTDMNDSQNFTPGGAGGQLFGVESIREFQVVTHNASAEYGRSMGGIINAVSKSGTNALHGDVYEFLRNSVLDAKNFFDDPTKPIPLLVRNQFGGSAGGPLRRDRLFFFANYEGLRERQGVSKKATVPADSARQGAVSAVVPYINLYPHANQPDGVTLLFSQTQPARVDYGTAKIDWNPSSKDSFFVRYTMDDSRKLRQDAPDHVVGLFAEDEIHRNQYVTLSETRVLSTNMLNTARFGFNRSTTLVNLLNQAGVPASLSFIPGQPFGRITVRGLSPLGATINDPRLFRMNSFQPSDDSSITLGAHALKTGFLLERFQWNTANFNRIGGDYSFDSLAHFLVGGPQSVTVPFPGSEPNRGIRAILFGTYFQDDYRATRRLTLNLGLRYEITTVPTEVNGKMWFLTDPSATALKTTQPFAGNHLNFAPRFGFAWDPRGNGKTSIRGGFGIYYDQILLNQFLNLFDRNPTPDLTHGWLTTTLSCPASKIPCPQSQVPFPNPLTVAQLTPSFTLQNAVFDDFKTPYSYQYNLTVQQQIAPHLMASAAYVGSRGKHIVERYDGNTPNPIVLSGTTACTGNGLPDSTHPILPAGTVCTPATLADGKTPFPRRNLAWKDLQTRRLAGLSYYDALQVSVVRSFSGGLQIQGIYNYSKSLDMSGGLFSEEADNAAVGTENPGKPFNEKGRSNFDVRHNAVINFLYQLPFGKSLNGFAGQVLGGWQLGTIATFSTGAPFTVENSANRSQDQATGANFSDRSNLAAGFSNNPTQGVSAGCMIGSTTVPAGTPVGTPDHWFDACAFRPQPLGTFGNLGRNTLTGPGVLDWDFLVGKHFRVAGERDLQFRAEFFDILNHPNFEAPNSNFRQIFDSSGNLLGSFGSLVRTTTTSRQVQFGLKFVF